MDVQGCTVRPSCACCVLYRSEGTPSQSSPDSTASALLLASANIPSGHQPATSLVALHATGEPASSSSHHVLAFGQQPTHENQAKPVCALAVWSVTLARKSSPNMSQQGEQQKPSSQPGLQLLGCRQPTEELHLNKAVHVLKSSQQHVQLVLGDVEGNLQVCKLDWSRKGGVDLTTVSQLPHTNKTGKVHWVTACCFALSTKVRTGICEQT